MLVDGKDYTLIIVLGFFLVGYLWSDFLTTRGLQKGTPSMFDPLMKLICGIISAGLILQIVGHSGLIK